MRGLTARGTMDILSLIRDMQAAPDKHITPVDPISLGAFLHGYMAANPAPWTAYNRLHRPDGTTGAVTRIWFRNSGTGIFHGYPAE